MAQYSLYVDTNSGTLVSGTASTISGVMPKLVQGDTISLRIYLLERTSTYPISSPYSVVNISNISLRVGIGQKTGTSGTALVTQQFTWAKDLTNNYFYADLPLNTAGIETLIGAASSGSAWFEIEMTQGGFPTTVFQQQVTIEAEVIETGSISVPAGLTALTAEEASATYLRKQNDGFVLTCPTDSTVKAYLYLGADGALHVEPITP